MLHDGEGELYEKLLLADIFPGMLLIGYISVTIYATTVEKYFFRSPVSAESIDRYG